MKRAFTLIELLVVLGMVAVLVGAVGSSMNKARRRAQVAKATQDVKEMTNAILAFENIAVGRSLEKYTTGWKETTESSLAMILGGETTESGEPSPVLYNAQVRGGVIRDPWGTPYQFIIKKVADPSKEDDKQRFVTAVLLPNFFRLDDVDKRRNDVEDEGKQ